MRIKKLQIENYQNLKKLKLRFFQKENIFYVIDPNQKDSFDAIFDEHYFLGLMNLLFFNDSYTFTKSLVDKNTLIECMVEKDGVECTFGVKGNRTKVKKNQRLCLKNRLDWYCCFPEGLLKRENGYWIETQFGYEPQEYFYPKALKKYFYFQKDMLVESPKKLLQGELLGWLQDMAIFNKRKVDLVKKIEEILVKFDTIKVDNDISVVLNERKEYVLSAKNGYIPSKENLILINFCAWINNLHILKELCDAVGENGKVPVAIKNFFENGFVAYKDVLLEKLKEMDRQIFILC